MSFRLKPLLLTLTLLLAGQTALAAAKQGGGKPASPVEPLEVELSHQLGDVQEAALQKLVSQFNAENPGAQIKLGQGNGTPDKLPTLVLLQGEEERRFLSGKPRFKPLWQVMREGKQTLDAAKPAAQMNPVSVDAQGRLQALPLGLATPVMFYNKAALGKIGVDAEAIPKDWFALQGVLGKLAAAGSDCPYASATTRWVHLENTDAWHNEAFAAAKGNGLTVNGLLNVKHLSMMMTWVKSRYMHLMATPKEGEERFLKGECAVLTTASSAAPALLARASFPVGVAPLPYHDDVRDAPRHTLARGANLWVTTGHKPAEYQLAARFVRFLLQPANQMAIQKDLGFLPLNKAGQLMLTGQAPGDDMAHIRVALGQLRNKPVTDNSRASRLADNRDIQDILDEELDALWSEKKPAKEALDTAVLRASKILAPGTGSAKAKK